MISVLEQCSGGCPNNGGISNLIYRFNQPLQQGFERHQIGTLAQMRASVSYIPGAHNMKFGYQGTSATRARHISTSRRSFNIASTTAFQIS